MPHDLEPQLLITAWLQDQQGPLEEEAFRWAYTSLQDLVVVDPDTAWPILLRLISLAPSDEVLVHIGAGPLEEALAFRHDAYLTRVLSEAPSNPRLHQCMQFVQLDTDPHVDGIPASVIEQLETAFPGFKRSE